MAKERGVLPKVFLILLPLKSVKILALTSVATELVIIQCFLFRT